MSTFDHCLPIDRHKRNILFLLEKHQVLLISGDTGCGKSTRIPLILLNSGKYTQANSQNKPGSTKYRQIVVTEPRRIAAIHLADRVAHNLRCNVGSLVGYAVRFDEKIDCQQTRVKYMTDGLLIREMMHDPMLSDYSVIMVDEAHERGTNNDLLLGLVRCILKQRQDLKLVVCSATLDIDNLVKYFSTKDGGAQDKPGVLVVEGKSYPLKIYQRRAPVPNFIDATIETIIDIHEKNRLSSGKILAFVTGQDEVEFICQRLEDYASTNSSRLGIKRLVVVPLFASLKPDQISRVFEEHSHNSRVCIIATNVAETSITIDQVAFVVDCGFTKIRYFDHRTGIDHLIRVPVSKSSAKQRAGRAGRTRNGQVYRLYSQSEYDKLHPVTTPEIQRSSLIEPLMLLKSLAIRNPRKFALLSPMPHHNLVAALETLYAIEAIDDRGNLTQIGELMTQLSLDPRISKTLIKSCQFNCSEDVCKIAAMLQVKEIFLKPSKSNNDILWTNSHLTDLCAEEGDLISYLNIFDAFLANDKSQRWAEKRFLNYQALLHANQIRIRLRGQLKQTGLEAKNQSAGLEQVQASIASGLFANVAYLHPSGDYKTIRGDQTIHIHPLSALSTLTDRPKHVIFVEILNTNKSYMRHLMAIEQSILLQAAPNFYSFSTELDMKRSQVR